MRCIDCDMHVDDTKGEGIIRVEDKHWLHLASVPSERLCALYGEKNLYLVGSFASGTIGDGMQEWKHPGCPYTVRAGG